MRGLARRRRRLLIVAGLTAAMLVASASFSRVARRSDACAAPPRAPLAQLALLPTRLSFRHIGPVTRVARDQRYLTVFAVTRKPLGEVTILIQEAVTAAGYRPAGMDNEGFEAEVFFTTDRYAAGQARIRGSGCNGRWDISLVLLDRAADEALSARHRKRKRRAIVRSAEVVGPRKVSE